jgi:nitrate/nitrite-specific signal transduction histidine kinase
MNIAKPSDWQVEKERVIQLVREATTRLSEHVDSVRILVTLHAEDGESTFSFDFGAGNFYAQRGQIAEWLVIQKEREREEVRGVEWSEEEEEE